MVVLMNKLLEGMLSRLLDGAEAICTMSQTQIKNETHSTTEVYT